MIIELDTKEILDRALDYPCRRCNVGAGEDCQWGKRLRNAGTMHKERLEKGALALIHHVMDGWRG